MGSQEGGSDNNVLSRKASLYGLTFGEVQNQLGKPLGSLNLDELLKIVWAAESSNQATGGEAAENGSSVVQNLGQSNVVMLSGDLSKKTVDEVWQDIQQNQNRNFLVRNVTLNNMTLEDFLVEAGVVTTELRKELGPAQRKLNCHQAPSLVFRPGHLPAPTGTQETARKRVSSDDIAEMSVERRQKRMIKNRESAARSRARNQAYTQELENKVSRLEEENERLKRRKELEKMFPGIPRPEPKYRLRRTSSAPM